MRDALVIPISEQESLVISSDNSGGVGMKEQDVVKASYDTVSYFSFRVAMMECLAAGAKPLAVVIQNFCGEPEWNELVAGVQKGLKELGLEQIQITGSTESNFPFVQSAMGLNVIGKKSNRDRVIDSSAVALIGLPLVGHEVLEQADEVAPLSLFYQLSLHEDVLLWPVGSKGVGHELHRLNLVIESNEINFEKSGGPATSFLLMYPKEREKEIATLAGTYFHSL
ncbi:ATP-binding protein [Robertmurraya yapensis]|uniref:ATP-binding protein n=1 Tax=Bacillus yapensis TaxID=2492960 RepID=A0A3S0KK40_9BACI|nr:AIR synthase related protein [Bacillus yapensis]RTR28475.1 ATP-binding protein [Bacillus yapensis]TKS94536.1 ATP-binding protein [Bacillus yapensis]